MSYFNYLQTGQWTGTLARICKSSILTDEDICKKTTCIQHCCPFEYFLESATNECKSAKLPGSDDEIVDDDDYQDDEYCDEHCEWFGNWNNETHKKVSHWRKLCISN